MEKILIVGDKHLSIARITEHLSEKQERIGLDKESIGKIEKSAAFFDRVQKEDTLCYGQNTSFGSLVKHKISFKDQNALQRRLVLSHASGANEPLSLRLSRIIFLSRIHYLARGVSGMRLETVKRLIFLYNQGAYPEVYMSGSLGASGDLAPLSHVAAFCIGEGWGYYQGKRLKSRRIHRLLNISPLVLSRKEGLSLINGTSAMVAISIDALDRIKLYFESSLIICALVIEQSQIPKEFLFLPAFNYKKHKGSNLIAEYLCKIVSSNGQTRATDPSRLQPPYSFRCVPYILGHLISSIDSLYNTLEIELNSVNDNPFYIEDFNKIYHGGHFHGMPISVDLDFLRISLVHLSGVIDRQLDMLMDSNRNYGLNSFLAFHPERGFCGFEGVQYLATSLHIENKNLAYPFSTQTIPTNAGNQDYVSLGMQSALNLIKMTNNLLTILSIYLHTESQIFNSVSLHLSNKKNKLVQKFIQSVTGSLYKDNVLMKEKIDSTRNDEIFKELVGCTRKAYRNLPKLFVEKCDAR